MGAARRPSNAGRWLRCAKRATAQKTLKRPPRLVKTGDDEPDASQKARISASRAERDLAKAALDRIREVSPNPAEIEPEPIEPFGRPLREKVTLREMSFRKARLQSIADRIEVGADVIRIIGGKESPENALIGSGSDAVSGVRTSVRKWRTRHDSNV